MANAELATRNFRFDMAMAALPEKLKEFLKLQGMDKVLVFTGYFEASQGSVELLEEATDLATHAGAGAETVEWASALLKLHDVAVAVETVVASKLAALDSFALSADLLERRNQGKLDQEDVDLRRLAAANLAALPTEWRGKAYRRAQLATTENARATAEEAERKKWGRELAGLLLEAKLPFSYSPGASSEEGFLRCCRGVRANTIQQRVSCWRPFRRWLLSLSKRSWPNEAQDLLDFFEVRRTEGAPRSAYGSLLSSLRFLEEAGEVLEQNRLCLAPSLTNAVKELALATSAKGKGSRERGQAPQMPLALVVAFEKVVLDTSRPRFQRAFAAFRLLRHWASLRWDDTQGLAPRSLERMARGVAGVLERTKTSGPGKTQQVLPCFISQDCWVEHEWLDKGISLLTSGSFDFDRDFLLPLPSANLEEASRRRALYSDSAGFSQSLHDTLEHGSGDAVLPLKAGRFWSDHSDRAGLDSWAGALGVQQSERDFLGRWAPKGSADAYVRTAQRIVENTQVLVAHYARLAWKGGADHFGEEALLKRFAAFLVEKGWRKPDAEHLADTLRCADYSLRVVPLNLAQNWALAAPRGATGPEGTDVEGEDEADTVGCCSLRVEHFTFHEGGKDVRGYGADMSEAGRVDAADDSWTKAFDFVTAA